MLADPRFSMTAAGSVDKPRTTQVTMASASVGSMDSPEHTRLRRLVASAFTARRIEALRPRAQEIANTLLDAMIERGAQADLADSFAWPLPITVISEMLGIPYADRGRFRDWTDQSMALSATDREVILEANSKLYAYISGLVEQRRAEPTDDLLGLLVAARDNEDRLSEDELVTFGQGLLVAGHETTANQIGNFVFTLLSRRELWEQLVADPDLVPKAVEELLRWIPLGASGRARIATEDLELGGRLIRKGDAVVAQSASGNRDPEVFENPEAIDFLRVEKPHLSFGHGVHHCVGAQLARMELQVAIGTLVRRLPGLRLAVPADEVRWRTDRLVRGVQALPVEW
jgi:cytochrome P450